MGGRGESYYSLFLSSTWFDKVDEDDLARYEVNKAGLSPQLVCLRQILVPEMDHGQ